MIRIRYSSELQPGLHGKAERQDGHTVIYLLPGLTAAERRAALRRVRQQGKMGICPRLPAGQLAAALLVDRVRNVFGQAGAIVRVHPAGSTLPVMALSVAITAFLVLSALSVHIHILHNPAQAAGGSVALRTATGDGPDQLVSTPSPGEQAGQVAGQSGGKQVAGGYSAQLSVVPTPTGAPDANPVTDPAPGQGSGSGSDPGSGSGSGGSSTPPIPGGVPTAVASTPGSTGSTTPPAYDPAPAPVTTTSGAPAPAPDPPTPSATSTGGTSGQVCVDIGSLGLCLGL